MNETPKQQRVFLDTNFVVAMGQPGTHLREQMMALFGADWKAGLTPAVQRELNERLQDKKTSRSTRIGLAIIGIRPHQLETKPNGLADEELAKLGKTGEFVATLDARLRKRIKAFGGPIVYLKKGHRVAVD